MLQYESLIQIQKEEVERRAHEAWKYQKEVPDRKGLMHFLERFQAKKQPAGSDCGCACAPC